MFSGERVPPLKCTRRRQSLDIVSKVGRPCLPPCYCALLLTWELFLSVPVADIDILSEGSTRGYEASAEGHQTI